MIYNAKMVNDICNAIDKVLSKIVCIKMRAYVDDVALSAVRILAFNK